MTSGPYGADVAELRALAQRFDQAATQLESSTRLLSTTVARSQDWVGPDASRFRSEWSSTSVPKVTRVVSELRAASTSLRANADDQERTSAADTGSTTSSSHPPPSTQTSALLDRFRMVMSGTTQVAGGALSDIEAFVKGADEVLPKHFERALGGLGVLTAGASVADDIAHSDVVAAIGDTIGGLTSGAGVVASFVPKAAFLGTLGPAAAGVGALQTFIHWTEPTTPEQVQSTYAMGLSHLNPGADPTDPTPEQATAMTERYSGVIGPLNMISDTMDATAQRIFPWNWK